MKIVSEEDLIYTAGFLDGEGCFTISNNKIVVTCANTYKPIVQWLHLKFGGSMTKKAKQRKINHRPIYIWKVVSKDADRFCKIISPYLKEKTEQALLLIAYQQTMGLSRNIKDLIKQERIYLSNITKGLKHVTW